MKKSKSIRAQIMSGFTKTTCMTFMLAISTFFSLTWIWTSTGEVFENLKNSQEIEQVYVAHTGWISELERSVLVGKEIEGGKDMDATTCSYAEWESTIDQNQNIPVEVQNARNVLAESHTELHRLAFEIVALSKTDMELVIELYQSDFKPLYEMVFIELDKIRIYYTESLNDSVELIGVVTKIAAIVTLFFSTTVCVSSFLLAKFTSKKIANPIVAVSEWANELSLGVDELDFDTINVDKNQLEEVGLLISAFRMMAENIKANVSIVQRVADGDMSAFVNIRSPKDTLGKNLYRLVQTNDALFHNIVEVANTVANNASQISSVSKSLAEGATAQVDSLSSLSITVQEAGSMISETSDKAQVASEITGRIKEIATESNVKMDELIKSIENISSASKHVSAVIKSIDNIAFQTNILALNAAVEAARAGEAGKGFAVVADEVRNLASKCAEAAQESALLVKDTIQKSQEGSESAADVSNVFHSIMSEIELILALNQEIATNSILQFEGVMHAKREIDIIGQSVEGTATISEESASSSVEMNYNSELLNKEMEKFKLRERQEGRAFIPAEKELDNDFIRYANDAYQKNVETGEHNQEWISSNKNEK